MCQMAHAQQSTVSVHIKPENKTNDAENLKQYNQNRLVHLKENAWMFSISSSLRTLSEIFGP
jgi:hypothetical protein